MNLQKSLFVAGLALALTACGDRASYKEVTEAGAIAKEGDGTAGDGSQSGPNSGDALPLPPDELSQIPRGDGTRGPQEQVINDKCAQANDFKTYEQEFLFPDPGHTCYWDYYDNLGRRTDFIRARTEQFQLMKLDPKAIVCKMELIFDAQTNVSFKDELMFAYNGVVLASSKNFSERLPKKYGMSMYSWPALANTDYNKSEDSRYCAGNETGDGECEIPTSEVSGNFSLNFSDSLFQRIEAYTDPECRGFTVVTTGDNDDNDCRHTDIGFKVRVKYVMP